MDTIIKGKIKYKLFINGVYSSKNIHPIKCILKITDSIKLYKIVVPEYDEYGILYDSFKLLKLNELYDIKIEYFDDHNNKYNNISDFKNNTSDNKLYRLITYYSRIDNGIIGCPENTWYYYKKGLIDIQKANSCDSVCSIGFKPDENKWYGWSHRAIYGFGLGSKIEKGDCAFIPNNKDEFIQSMIDWYKDDYDNIIIHKDIFDHDDHNTNTIKNINNKIDTVIDMYNLNNIPMFKNVLNFKDKGINYMVNNNTYTGLIQGINITCYTNNKIVVNRFIPYPDKYGKGEWEAYTLEDAKEMAIDYAESVS